ncbi:NADPH:quinone oxidoreductase family protein [Streptomyces sp. NPDC046977]|uniref:NADPH:quinone oxidoreductase family protein n=1 Tax=Streptomyces sp. NPDC046977 TaxID=3154703 RepID=UPI0033D65E81
MNTTTGKAWRAIKFGPPAESVELQQLTWEAPPEGHVLIRVSTAGAGFPDVMMTAGQYPLLGDPPFGLGEEAAGEVVAVSTGSRLSVGDRVTGITAFLQGWGGFAEYAYLREISTIRIPPTMTDEEAGGFPIGFRTAYAALVDRTPIEAGQTLLVLGAAGSTGTAAMQLGKALGAKVIAVAGSQDKLDFCSRHGADHVIGYRDENLTARLTEITDGRGIDLIFDPVGGDTAATALKSIARNGRIALVGVASGNPVPLNPMDMLLRNYSAVGVLATPGDPEAEALVWERLAELAGAGKVTMPVGRVYDFHDVPRMITEQSTPGPGKSVVRVASA